MENKKDIGTIFKERLNQLDKSPNENGWIAIQNELDKKKKRRYISFWFFYIGLFSTGILLTWLIYHNSEGSNSFIKSDENEVTFQIETEKSNSLNENYNSNNTSVLETKTEQNSNMTINRIGVFNNKSKATIKTKENFSNSKNNNLISGKTKRNNLKSNKDKNENIKPNIDKNNSKNKSETINSSQFFDNETSKELNTDVSFNDSIKNTSIDKLKTTIADSLKRKKIAENNITKDSTKNENIKPITVFVFGSPTYSSYLSNNKSVLDTRLDKNSTTSQITFSYGLYLCYKGNDKISIRLGYSKNNLKFITNNVLVNTFNYSNINYSSGYSNDFIYNNSSNSEFMKITQEISYSEIPFEFKYNIINRKIGLNAIVGFNYLLLDKNNISVLTSNGNKFLIGETKSLLKSSFGVNLGFGLEYQITKKIKFNLEPMIKLHLKEYQDLNQVHPYSLNILTGIEFEIFRNK